MQERNLPWHRPRNAALAVIVAGFLVLIWTGREVWLVYSADRTLATNYRAKFREVNQSLWGIPPEQGEAAWSTLSTGLEKFQRTLDAINRQALEGGFERRNPKDNGQIDFERVTRGIVLPSDIDRERKALDQLSRNGVLGLQEFMSIGPGLRSIDGNNDPLAELMPEVGPVRSWAKCRVASMRVALSRGDFAEIRTATQELAAVSQTMSHQRGIISFLVGNVIHQTLLTELRFELLEAPFDETTCTYLLQTLDRFPVASVVHGLEGERLGLHDTLQWYFSDDGQGDGFMLA